MRSRHLFVMLIMLLGGTLARAESQFRDTPAYLPRAVWTGVFINNGAVSPQLRVQWEGFLVQQYRDALVVVGELGGGYATMLPNTAGPDSDKLMTSFYQHSLVAGIGLRSWRGRNFHWGGQLLLGPQFYGATFEDLPTENRLNGIIEARLRAGWDLGPLSLGASAGYAAPFSRPILSNAAEFVGGWMVGLYLDWWH